MFSYTYVNVDEGWLKGRYPNGNIIIYYLSFFSYLILFSISYIWQYSTIYSDDEKFPSGMKALGDYIHSLGLKYIFYFNFILKIKYYCLNIYFFIFIYNIFFRYGLYTCRGSCQCSTSEYSGPGSLGYYYFFIYYLCKF